MSDQYAIDGHKLIYHPQRVSQWLQAGQDWDRAKQEYGPDKYTIRRYQKRNGVYMQKSKFNISSKDQAKSIIAALQNWIED